MNEKFDKNDNLIYWKDSNGNEYWNKFDENDHSIYTKFSSGREIWYKYDENNNGISITEQEFKQIKRNKERQEFLYKNKYCNRFELIDI